MNIIMVQFMLLIIWLGTVIGRMCEHALDGNDTFEDTTGQKEKLANLLRGISS